MGIVYKLNLKSETSGERGLPKLSVESANVSIHGLMGDFNRYREEKHSGKDDWALLLMPLEMIEVLNNEGWPIEPGHLGENITTQGIHYKDFTPGSEWKIGLSHIQISEACTPCGNLKHLPYVGQDRKVDFIKTMVNRRGWYARVLEEGIISERDLIHRL